MAKLVFTPDQIERTYKIVDAGLYYVRLNGFKPKEAAKGGSYNLNPQLEITKTGDGKVAPMKDDGGAIPVFYNLNTKAPWIMIDFCHMFGIPHEVVRNADGTQGIQMPGIWTPESEPDLAKCEYKGPLVGKEGLLYLLKQDWQKTDAAGNPVGAATVQNKVKYFQCAVPNCATKFPKIKHVDDLTKQKGT